MNTNIINDANAITNIITIATELACAIQRTGDDVDTARLELDVVPAYSRTRLDIAKRKLAAAHAASADASSAFVLFYLGLASDAWRTIATRASVFVYAANHNATRTAAIAELTKELDAARVERDAAFSKIGAVGSTWVAFQRRRRLCAAEHRVAMLTSMIEDYMPDMRDVDAELGPE